MAVKALACSVATPLCNGKKANSYSHASSTNTTKTPTNASPTTLTDVATAGSSSGGSTNATAESNDAGSVSLRLAHCWLLSALVALTFA